jgi:hypothetical protein
VLLTYSGCTYTVAGLMLLTDTVLPLRHHLQTIDAPLVCLAALDKSSFVCFGKIDGLGIGRQGVSVRGCQPHSFWTRVRRDARQLFRGPWIYRCRRQWVGLPWISQLFSEPCLEELRNHLGLVVLVCGNQ